MIVEIVYSTLSKKHPRFSKILEFNDGKHLNNYISKANREGKKIVTWTVVSDPCVWILNAADLPNGMEPSINVAKINGERLRIKDFQKRFNNPEDYGPIEMENSWIFFENINCEEL